LVIGAGIPKGWNPLNGGWVTTGGSVGDFIGFLVGAFIGFLVGDFIGFLEGAFVGSFVGSLVGSFVGAFVGFLIGESEGDTVGGVVVTHHEGLLRLELLQMTGLIQEVN
jgi:hypothetical protein